MKKLLSFVTVMVTALGMAFSASAATLPATKVTATAKTDTAITVSWDKVDGAEKYNVYILKPSETSYKILGSTSNTTAYIDSLVKGTEYKFKVIAVDVADGNENGGVPSAAATATAGKIVSVAAAYTGNLSSKDVLGKVFECKTADKSYWIDFYKNWSGNNVMFHTKSPTVNGPWSPFTARSKSDSELEITVARHPWGLDAHTLVYNNIKNTVTVTASTGGTRGIPKGMVFTLKS